MCKDLGGGFPYVPLGVGILLAIVFGSIAAIIVIYALQVDLDKRSRASARASARVFICIACTVLMEPRVSCPLPRPSGRSQ